MSEWSDLVTTALLGTDRRPLPDHLPEPMAMLSAVLEEPDPAARLLDLAAGYSMVAKTQDVTAPAVLDQDPPDSQASPAPTDARSLLTELLTEGDFLLVNAWLRRCIDHGCVLAAEQWCTVLTAAAHHRSVDRVLLGRALGDRGIWFAGLNPDWAALHRAVAKVQVEPSERPAADDRSNVAEGAAPVAEERAIVERVLRTAQPWTEANVRAGLGASCRAGRRALSATVLDRFALGLPLETYPMIREAADYFLEGLSPRTASELRAAHEVLVRVEGIVHDRIRIDTAFGDRLDVGPRMIIHHPHRSLP